MKRPDWLTGKIPNAQSILDMTLLLNKLKLHSVCESAACPNIGVCFAKHIATFMILGNVCTRNCTFCAVRKGKPLPPDPDEPKRVAAAVKKLNLNHVVITSVTRDDLDDFGAANFVETINEIRNISKATIEVLVPDFRCSLRSIELIVKSKPDVINHNVETVPRLYPVLRPTAVYANSLQLLCTIKSLDNQIYTKSGMMVGLGESKEEVFSVMKDLRSADCDIITIGQYLQPSRKHFEIKEYVHPKRFEEYKLKGEALGFSYVASGPLVRSSFNADEVTFSLKKGKTFISN